MVLNLKEITEQVFRDIAYRAIQEAIEENPGYGLDNGIQQVIKNKALEIIEEPEIKEMIREAMIYWIKKQK
jgi:hypothetical protein